MITHIQNCRLESETIIGLELLLGGGSVNSLNDVYEAD